MSILGIDRDHDIRQDKLLTALIVSIIVHILLFIFFSQLAPLYRRPGIIKKNYEVLLLGKADREAKGKELKKEKEEEPLKLKEEPAVEEMPPPPPPKEEVKEVPQPAPPVAEQIPVPVETKPDAVKKVITSEPSPVKAKSIPPKESTPREKVVEKKVEKPEKTVYSSTTDDTEKKKKSKTTTDASGKASEKGAEGAPVPAGHSYMELIKALVFKNLKYPPAAKINRIEGDVSVSFLISMDGDSEDINIKRSSGFPILDDGALRAIRKSEPFPSFEGSEDVTIVHMGGEKYAAVSFNIKFSLDYITMGAE